MDLKSSIELRVEMAAKGWNSHDSITDMGWGDKGRGYSIWFERWDWHDQALINSRGRKACYHAHTPDLSKIDDAVREAARIALRAWDEFPGCPPDQQELESLK